MEIQWLTFIFIVIVIALSAFLYYIKRAAGDKEETTERELETSLKEQMLTGISVPKPGSSKAEQEEPSSFWAKLYSGKGPQPKYMRYIAADSRKKAVEAARLAAKKEAAEKQEKEQ